MNTDSKKVDMFDDADDFAEASIELARKTTAIALAHPDDAYAIIGATAQIFIEDCINTVINGEPEKSTGKSLQWAIKIAGDIVGQLADKLKEDHSTLEAIAEYEQRIAEVRKAAENE